MQLAISKLWIPVVVATLAVGAGSCKRAPPPPPDRSLPSEDPTSAPEKTGGVLVLGLQVLDLPSQPNHIGPEVLLMRFSDKPTQQQDGTLLVAVENLADALNSDPRCSTAQACKQFADRYANHEKVKLPIICTGAFVDEDTILTAAHCVNRGIGEHWFGVVGFRADVRWKLDNGLMHVPPTNVVRLCHVEGKNKPGYNDAAFVHVCPVTQASGDSDDEGTITLDTLDVAPDQADPVPPLHVLSHGLGMPSKKYEVRLDTINGRRKAFFTNFGGGSGSAIIDDTGRIVGVVQGFVDPNFYATCTVREAIRHGCAGQWVTWAPAINSISTSDNGHSTPQHHHQCQKITNTDTNPDSNTH